MAAISPDREDAKRSPRFAYRHQLGLPYVYPDNDLSYPGNFLSMMYKMTEVRYEPDPRLRACAGPCSGSCTLTHEQNCSTNAVRGRWARSQVDPYSAVTGGRGRALRPAARRRQRGSAQDARPASAEVENIPDFLEGVKNREEKLMGFGHRVYKNYDPGRAPHHQEERGKRCFEVTGMNPKLENRRRAREAARLRRRVLHRAQALPPTVDFYSGLIYEAMGLPTDMFHRDVRDPRATSGWAAQWLEMVEDKDTKIARPAPGCTPGSGEREFVPMDQR